MGLLNIKVKEMTMAEDLSLKHSPSIVDITNVEDVLTTVELDCTDLCAMDTLLRIDEHPEVPCRHCVYKDITIGDDEVCPIRIIGEFLVLK